MKNKEVMQVLGNKLDINIYQNIRQTLVLARTKVHKTINFEIVNAYWYIGKQIAEAFVDRAEYGKNLLQYLSEKLTEEFGKGFNRTNLGRMKQFYLTFPIIDTLCQQLSWSHYRLLIKIFNDERRNFYLKECAESNWSVRQLERQINSFFYDRLLATQQSCKKRVKNEIYKLEPKTDPDYILKDPFILEFLDLKENKKYLESQLEQALIDKLQEFLLELSKGFAFVARQKRISFDEEHFFVDLVFYNYILKCFVVIDLKTGKLTHQDIGQVDCYRCVFDDKIKDKDDNPTIGLILCAKKNDSVVKYSVLSENKNHINIIKHKHKIN